MSKTDSDTKRKRPTKKRAHRTTVRSLDHADRPPMVGQEDRLDAYAKRSLQLKRLGYYHFEISKKLMEEFNLPYEPPITTIADWLKKGSDAIRADIEELQWQMRIEQYKELDRMKRKFLQLACAEELAIMRWEMVEGHLQPQLDENAVKEQIDAGRICVSIMARQAKLLGLDMEKAVTPTGEGPGSLQELQLWIVGQVNVSTGTQQSGIVDIQTERLELRSGIPDNDSV